LGRPLDTPDAAAFQTRGVMVVLGLLSAGNGPVLAEFLEDAPVADDLTDWACPINLAPRRDEAETEAGRLSTAFAGEISRLRP
jgi:hypothetical protein